MKIRWVVFTLMVVLCAVAEGRAKRDYIVTGAKPDHLFVIDPGQMKVVSDFHIPDANNWVATIVPSADGAVAYVLTNKMQSIAGIDLATGKQVFRADLSSGVERVICFYSFDVTPDGKELIVFEIPVRLGLSEYRVEDTRFAVFNTHDGLGAKPVRTFAAPRGVSTVLARKDGKSFYSLGFNLYEFDRLTGKQIGERGVHNWDFKDRSIPDVLAVRPVTEPTGTFLTAVSSTESASAAGARPVPKTTLMSLDLSSGDLEYHDMKQAEALFSTVRSPTLPEAYGVYTDLTKIDLKSYEVVGRVGLSHTYYAVLVSSDGSEVYAAGASRDVTFFDRKTLAMKGNIQLPGDQSATSPRLVRR